MAEKCQAEASPNGANLEFLVGLGEQLARSMYPIETLAVQTEPDAGIPIELGDTEIPPDVCKHLPVPLCEAGLASVYRFEYSMTFDQEGQRAIVAGEPALAMIFSRDSQYSHSAVVYEIAPDLHAISRNIDYFRFVSLTDEIILDVMLEADAEPKYISDVRALQSARDEMLAVDHDEFTALAVFLGRLVSQSQMAKSSRL